MIRENETKPDKKRLSADAKILILLMREQPLTKEEIIKKAGISRSQYYRIIKILVDKNILRRHDDKYVIIVGGYKNGYFELGNVFKMLTEEYITKTVSLDDLAQLVGKPPKEIESAAYMLAEKYKVKIGSTSFPPIASQRKPSILEGY